MSQPQHTVLYVSHLNELRMGGQRSLAALITHLDRGKVYAVAMCPGSGPLSEYLESIGVKVYDVRFPALTLKNLPALRACISRIRELLRAERIDIIHSDEERAGLLCKLAARRLPVHLLWHVRITKRHHLDALNSRCADAIIGVSRGVLQRFPNAARLERKFRVIFNGVDCEIFTPVPDRGPLREKLGLPAGRRLILFAGQIKGGKGIADLAAAHSILKRQLPPERMPLLLYVGTLARDPAVDEVHALIQQHAMQADVRFMPQQSNIHEWMQAADILVLPSHEGFEGMGRVLFEAMACGAVAIGSDTTGVREALSPESGILVSEKAPQQLAAALLHIIQNPEQAAAMVAAGIERARALFDIRAHARAVENYYDDIRPRQ